MRDEIHRDRWLRRRLPDSSLEHRIFRKGERASEEWHFRPEDVPELVQGGEIAETASSKSAESEIDKLVEDKQEPQEIAEAPKPLIKKAAK